MRIAESIKAILAEHLPELKKKYPIERLALFGSVTRDDFDAEKSDVDIMVEFNGEIGWEFFDLAEELEKIVGRKTDLVSKGGIKPRYWEHMKDDVQYV